MEIIIQLITTMIVAFVEKFINKKMDDSFDKTEYCVNYLKQRENKQINNVQIGNINNSNTLINQTNTSIINNTEVNIKSNANSSSDDAIVTIGVIIFALALFVFSFAYLKSKLYFDYWYPILLMFLSIVSLTLFYNRFRKNSVLYWNREQHFSSILLLLSLYFILSFYLFQDDQMRSALEQLEISINSNSDIPSMIASTIKFMLNELNTFMYFTYNVILLFIPLGFFVADIYSQIKGNKPILNINLIILTNVLVVLTCILSCTLISI